MILVVVLATVSVTQAARDPCQDDDTIRCVLIGNQTRVRFLSKGSHLGRPIPFGYDINSAEFEESDLSTQLRVKMDTIKEVDVSQPAITMLQPATDKTQVSSTNLQQIVGYAPTEVWNTTLENDRYDLSIVGQTTKPDTCQASPGAHLCVNINVTNTLSQLDTEIVIPGPQSRASVKGGAMIVRTTIAGWDWENAASIFEASYTIAVTSLIVGEIERIVVADKPLMTNHSSPTTVSLLVVTTNAAFDMAFYGNAVDTFIVDPKENTIKLRSPQSSTPFAWTYVIRPLSKAELQNSTHTSDDLSSIGGSPYIFIASLGAAGLLVILGLIGLVWCLVRRKRNQKKSKSRSRSSSRSKA